MNYQKEKGEKIQLYQKNNKRLMNKFNQGCQRPVF